MLILEYPQPPLPISSQGAEHDSTENHRDCINIIRRRSHGLAWVYAYFRDGRQDHFVKVPEHDVVDHLESELFCWDDPADIPVQVEVTLPRFAGRA